jgi:hypothetical protein
LISVFLQRKHKRTLRRLQPTSQLPTYAAKTPRYPVPRHRRHLNPFSFSLSLSLSPSVSPFSASALAMTDFRDADCTPCPLAKDKQAIIAGRHTQNRPFGDAATTVRTALKKLDPALASLRRAVSAADDRLGTIVRGVDHDEVVGGFVINSTMEKFLVPGLRGSGSEPPEDFVACYEVQRVLRCLNKIKAVAEELKGLEAELERDISMSEEGQTGYMLFRARTSEFEEKRMGPKVDL